MTGKNIIKDFSSSKALGKELYNSKKYKVNKVKPFTINIKHKAPSMNLHIERKKSANKTLMIKNKLIDDSIQLINVTKTSKEIKKINIPSISSPTVIVNLARNIAAPFTPKFLSKSFNENKRLKKSFVKPKEENILINKYPVKPIIQPKSAFPEISNSFN